MNTCDPNARLYIGSMYIKGSLREIEPPSIYCISCKNTNFKCLQHQSSQGITVYLELYLVLPVFTKGNALEGVPLSEMSNIDPEGHYTLYSLD